MPPVCHVGQLVARWKREEKRGMGHSLAGPATSPAAPRQRGVCLCSRAMAAGRRPPRSRTRLSGDRRDRAAASRPERSSVAQQRGTVTSGQVVALLEFFERFKRGVSTCAQPPTSSFDAGHNSWNGGSHITAFATCKSLVRHVRTNRGHLVWVKYRPLPHQHRSRFFRPQKMD